MDPLRIAGYRRSMVRRLAQTLVQVLVLASLPLLACTTPSDDTGADACELDLEQIRAEILVPHCTGEWCHDAVAPMAGLDFTRSVEGITEQLVDVPSTVCANWVRVIPGDPERSILLAKLLDLPPCGDRMPVDGHLSAHDIACIERWIETLE
jgi:hypothetical protein